MINTPLMFCRLCMTANDNGLDECHICGTGIMMKPYLVRLTLEIAVAEFSELEATERAIASATGNIMEYIVGIETGELEQDDDN